MSIETYNRILPEFKTYHEKVYNFVYKLSYKERGEVPTFSISTIEFQKMQVYVFWDDVYNNRMVEIQRTKGPIREYWNLERVPNSEKFKITHIHSKLEDYKIEFKTGEVILGRQVNFPNYKAKIPNLSGKKTVEVVFDFDLLAKLNKAIGKRRTSKIKMTMVLDENGEIAMAPILINNNDESSNNFNTLILMPMRK